MPEKLKDFRVADLEAELEKRDLPIRRAKAVLTERLKEAEGKDVVDFVFKQDKENEGKTGAERARKERHRDRDIKAVSSLDQALNGMRIIYRYTAIIQDQDPLSQSNSLYIIMVGVSYHCPGQIRISVPRQYPMSWSENDFEMRV